MKKNNSILVLGILSISLLIILSIIQNSIAQRHDNPRHYYSNLTTTIAMTTIIDIVMSNKIIIMIRVMEIIMTTIIDIVMSNIKRV